MRLACVLVLNFSCYSSRDLIKLEQIVCFRLCDLELTLLQSLLPVWTHDGSPTTALQVNTHVEHFKEAIANNPKFLQDKVKQYFKVCVACFCYKTLMNIIPNKFHNYTTSNVSTTISGLLQELNGQWSLLAR